MSLNCSLSRFLSLYHDEIESFKDRLIGIDIETLAEACVSIVLGMDCATLTTDDQNVLFNSIKSLIPQSSLLGMACSLQNDLSFNSSILDIFKTIRCKYPALRGIAIKVLESLQSMHWLIIV